MNQVRHIAFCCDDNYLIPACIMLESLLHRNRGVRFIAHTFGNDLSEKSLDRLEKVLVSGGSQLVVYELPDQAEERIQNAPTLDYITRATYYRLFLPYVIDSHVRKVLYLDCDILVRVSVMGLFRKTAEGTALIGISDLKEEVYAARIGTGQYVNAGVLVMDMKVIRDKYSLGSMLDTISDILRQPGKTAMGDQDMINILFAGHIEKEAEIYNFQRLVDKRYCIRHPVMLRKAVVVHFITPEKPWHEGYLNVFAGEYYSYLRKYLTPGQRTVWWLAKPGVIFRMFRKQIGQLTPRRK